MPLPFDSGKADPMHKKALTLINVSMWVFIGVTTLWSEQVRIWSTWIAVVGMVVGAVMLVTSWFTESKQS